MCVADLRGAVRQSGEFRAGRRRWPLLWRQRSRRAYRRTRGLAPSGENVGPDGSRSKREAWPNLGVELVSAPRSIPDESVGFRCSVKYAVLTAREPCQTRTAGSARAVCLVPSSHFARRGVFRCRKPSVAGDPIVGASTGREGDPPGAHRWAPGHRHRVDRRLAGARRRLRSLLPSLFGEVLCRAFGRGAGGNAGRELNARASNFVPEERGISCHVSRDKFGRARCGKAVSEQSRAMEALSGGAWRWNASPNGGVSRLLSRPAAARRNRRARAGAVSGRPARTV